MSTTKEVGQQLLTSNDCVVPATRGPPIADSELRGRVHTVVGAFVLREREAEPLCCEARHEREPLHCEGEGGSFALHCGTLHVRNEGIIRVCWIRV